MFFGCPLSQASHIREAWFFTRNGIEQAMSTLDSRPIRALVTDDTAVYRRLLRDVLSSIPGVDVVGTSYDGDDCLQMLEKFQPDLVTLDINMPRRDGLSTLDEIRRRNLNTHVVMVSTASPHSAEQTLHALNSGALDMILKPTGNDAEENKRSLEHQLLHQVETVRGLLGRSGKNTRTRCDVPTSPQSEASTTKSSKMRRSERQRCFDCLCIGVSTGGPAALADIIPKLPKSIEIPIFIVQHMPPLFTKSLADHLNAVSSLEVLEAAHGMVAKPGVVYIAPGGRQMAVQRNTASFEIHVTDDTPDAGCRPSVDHLLHSIAVAGGHNSLVLILTGMGNDGLNGCRELSSAGSYILAQSAESCVVYGMPRHVVENNLANEILPLNMVADRIIELTKASK